MKMKKAIMLFLTVLLTAALFMGCEDASGTTVTLVADDGFGLESATVPFNASTSVAVWSSSPDWYEADNVLYAATDLSELEDGSPAISFTFNESLRSNSINAIFGIFDDDGDLISNDNGTTISDHSIEINGTFVEDVDVTVSGATVTFSVEEDTFSIDDYVMIGFGVVSAKGEFYSVCTYFQPQADIVDTPVLTADFSDYYAYAIDSDKVYVLNPAVENDCVNGAEPHETIYGASISGGTDFGDDITKLSVRATEDSSDYSNTDNMFQSLQYLEDNGTILDYIPLTFNYVDYAKEYYFYRVDAEGDGYHIDGYTSDPNIGECWIDLLSYEYEYDEETGDIFSRKMNLHFEDDPIEEGDCIYLIPKNSRGEFEDCAAVYELTDTVQPYAYTTLNTDVMIDAEVTTPLTAPGPDYGDHDERNDASWGHLYEFDSFSVTNPTGSEAFAFIEGVEFTMTDASLTPRVLNSSTAPSEGGFKRFTSAEFIEWFEDDDEGPGYDSDDYTIISNTAGTAWCTFDGDTVTVYLGFYCNDGDDGIDYSVANYEVYGNLDFTVTDMSGNELMFRTDDEYADDETSMHNDGELTIELNSID